MTFTRKEKARAHQQAMKQSMRVSRNKPAPVKTEALMKNTRARKGKCPQKIGMWGTISTDYRTPSGSTHDSRWDATLSSQAV